jgi:uncharacterized membrane protein
VIAFTVAQGWLVIAAAIAVVVAYAWLVDRVVGRIHARIGRYEEGRS